MTAARYIRFENWLGRGLWSIAAWREFMARKSMHVFFVYRSSLIDPKSKVCPPLLPPTPTSAPCSTSITDKDERPTCCPTLLSSLHPLFAIHKLLLLLPSSSQARYFPCDVLYPDCDYGDKGERESRGRWAAAGEWLGRANRTALDMACGAVGK